MSPIVFFIEGNIGTGKSTFIKNLQEIYNCEDSQFIQEPVDVWKDTKDNDNKNILEYFYKDMHRFCYLFQSYAFISRINQIDQIDKSCEFVFIERSVFCDKNVFAKTKMCGLSDLTSKCFVKEKFVFKLWHLVQ